MNFQPNKPGAVVIYIQKAIRVETRISSKKLNQLGQEFNETGHPANRNRFDISLHS
jgi:hypothetical protein